MEHCSMELEPRGCRLYAGWLVAATKFSAAKLAASQCLQQQFFVRLRAGPRLTVPTVRRPHRQWAHGVSPVWLLTLLDIT